MSKGHNSKVSVATVCALLGAALVPTAAIAQAGIPALVDASTDLAAQTPGLELGGADSIYFTSRVKAGGHDIGLLVHVVSIPNGPGQKIVLSVTDETMGYHNCHVTQIQPDDFH